MVAVVEVAVVAVTEQAVAAANEVLAEEDCVLVARRQKPQAVHVPEARGKPVRDPVPPAAHVRCSLAQPDLRLRTAAAPQKCQLAAGLEPLGIEKRDIRRKGRVNVLKW